MKRHHSFYLSYFFCEYPMDDPHDIHIDHINGINGHG